MFVPQVGARWRTIKRARGSGSSSLRISVLNDEGQVYREILSEDISEHAALLGRLASLGFEVVAAGEGVQMHWQRTTPFSRKWPRTPGGESSPIRQTRTNYASYLGVKAK